jgi:hypothetical protein
MTIRTRLRGVVRRVAPGSVAALEEVRRLREDVDALARRIDAVSGRFDDLDARLRARGEQVDGLRSTVAELDAGLAESRRLSLRIAQLADLVFDELGEGRRGATDQPAAP